MSHLDNPIWNSLMTRHSIHAMGDGLARRYPSEMGPFAAVADQSEKAGADLLEIVNPGERVGLLGVVPRSWDGWTIHKELDLFQYVWDHAGEATEPDTMAVPLTRFHLDAMLELTALVYPTYFRAETAAIGNYYGIIEDNQLCAMAGIRMAMNGFQEISAVCTHPNHRGKGYASRLTRHLVHEVQRNGDLAFLHTESDNEPAQAVYAKLGFQRRRVIPFWLVDRL